MSFLSICLRRFIAMAFLTLMLSVSLANAQDNSNNNNIDNAKVTEVTNFNSNSSAVLSQAGDSNSDTAATSSSNQSVGNSRDIITKCGTVWTAADCTLPGVPSECPVMCRDWLKNVVNSNKRLI